jgi:hypothetical protein
MSPIRWEIRAGSHMPSSAFRRGEAMQSSMALRVRIRFI